jgi:Lar family restriction alleviation protein
MTSPDLKACPLCGDKDEFNPSVSTSYKYANPGTASTDLVEFGHFIECDKCGCVGPIKPLEEAAIAAWNQRASTDDEVRMLREALDLPSVTSSIEMLRERYTRARCDNEAVAGCVRCNVMFLIRTIERTRAALKQGAE